MNKLRAGFPFLMLFMDFLNCVRLTNNPCNAGHVHLSDGWVIVDGGVKPSRDLLIVFTLEIDDANIRADLNMRRNWIINCPQPFTTNFRNEYLNLSGQNQSLTNTLAVVLF